MEKFLTIVKEMKVVIFDMYGVINFGSGVSPTVLQALKTLREDGKIVIILSNASFGSADAVSKYAKKGMFKGVHYDDVVTSGQFGYEAIQRGDVPVLGTTMYVFGTANFKRPEDKLPDLFKDSVYSVTEDMEKADFAYCKEQDCWNIRLSTYDEKTQKRLPVRSLKSLLEFFDEIFIAPSDTLFINGKQITQKDAPQIFIRK